MPNSDGYVQELDYTHGYCREIAPAHIRLACLAQGVDLPITDRPMRYLEMAFGQGVSVNIHAAACPGEYWGFDFNPKHAGHARNLAMASGAMLIVKRLTLISRERQKVGPVLKVIGKQREHLGFARIRADAMPNGGAGHAANENR